MITANLGFPRIGVNRELKFAVERFWSGASSENELQAVASDLRRVHWRLQAGAGIRHIPSNDFSLYDHVLDTAVMVGAIPARFRDVDPAALQTYFAMARGTEAVRPMEMTKWFDTNYHYIVPEFEPRADFCLHSGKPIREFLEALALGILTRPVLLGPVSFVLLGKCIERHADRLDVVERLVPIYEELLKQLSAAGAEWIQIDEPFLAMDLQAAERATFAHVYGRLGSAAPAPKIMLATYFSGLQENLQLALALPVAAVHLDLVRAPEQLLPALNNVPERMSLSLGLVDGRNIWRTKLDRALALLNTACERIGPDRIQIAPSSSLLHVPVDLDTNTTPIQRCEAGWRLPGKSWRKFLFSPALQQRVHRRSPSAWRIIDGSSASADRRLKFVTRQYARGRRRSPMIS